MFLLPLLLILLIRSHRLFHSFSFANTIIHNSSYTFQSYPVDAELSSWACSMSKSRHELADVITWCEKVALPVLPAISKEKRLS